MFSVSSPRWLRGIFLRAGTYSYPLSGPYVLHRLHVRTGTRSYYSYLEFSELISICVYHSRSHRQNCVEFQTGHVLYTGISLTLKLQGGELLLQLDALGRPDASKTLRR